MQYSEVPENELWRVSVILELAVKNMDLPEFSESEGILTYACFA